MIILIFASAALLTILLDYRWLKHSKFNHRRTKVILAIALTLINLLPLVTIAIGIPKNNENIGIAILAWILTVYVITTLVRVAFYAGTIIFRDKKIGKTIGTILSGCVAVTLLYSLVSTRTDITIKRVEIKDNDILASFEGFRILFFSDLHICSLLNKHKEIDRLVTTINDQKADMVIFGGDLIHINHRELTDKIISQLSAIKAPYGVYTVLGNHDTGVYIPDTLLLSKSANIAHLSSKYRQMNWTLLQDSTIYVSKGSDSIAVTGIDFTDALLKYKHSFATPDDYLPTEIFDSIDSQLFNIAISHLPHLWHPISDSGCADLVLSGHIHATQFAINCFGLRLSPAMLMYKEWSGLYSDANSSLYITDGIGSVGFYLRVGAKPELTLIELKR